MKKILPIIMVIMLVLALTACTTETVEVDETETSAVETTQEETTEEITEEETTEETTNLSFTITGDDAGDYGELITYNAGTESEEIVYAYHVPEGTYTVKNNGAYMNQINVYSDETTINDEGWEEPASSGDVKLIDSGSTDTITVESGQHIEVGESSNFELTLQ